MEMMGNLSEDLVVSEIFDRIPIKQLIRMKCLSKNWCHSISHYGRSRTRCSNSNLVLQYKFTDVDQDSQVISVNLIQKVDNQNGVNIVETLENHLLRFSIDKDMKLMGSSNGFILCKRYNYADNIHIPYVYNPSLNQWVSIPPISKATRSIFMGLAFDGVGVNFKVVWHYLNTVDSKHLSCAIYKSDTGKWRKHRARLFNSSLVSLHMIPFNRNEVCYMYRKGMVHWLLWGYMLVYHFEKMFFKIIKLPWDNVGRVWESEGYLHHGGRYHQQFIIWKFMDGAILDVDDSGEDTMGKWQRTYCIEINTLVPQLPEIFGPNFVEFFKDTYFELLGYNEDLHILYIGLPETLLSYSFETKKLNKISTCKAIGETKNLQHHFWQICASFSMQSSGVNLHLRGDCKYVVS